MAVRGLLGLLEPIDIHRRSCQYASSSPARVALTRGDRRSPCVLIVARRHRGRNALLLRRCIAVPNGASVRKRDSQQCIHSGNGRKQAGSNTSGDSNVVLSLGPARGADVVQQSPGPPDMDFKWGPVDLWQRLWSDGSRRNGAARGAVNGGQHID